MFGKTNKNTSIVLFLILILVIGAFGAKMLTPQWAFQRTLSLDDIPAAARKTIVSKTLGGTIQSIHLDLHEGCVQYIVNTQTEEKPRRFAVSYKGHYIDLDDTTNDEIGRHADSQILPPAVSDALNQYLGSSMDVQCKINNGVSLYAITFLNTDPQQTITISDDGQIVDIQEQIRKKNLPYTIRSYLDRTYPNAVIHQSQRVQSCMYKFDLSWENQSIQLTMAPNGFVHEIQSNDKKENSESLAIKNESQGEF